MECHRGTEPGPFGAPGCRGSAPTGEGQVLHSFHPRSIKLYTYNTYSYIYICYRRLKHA